MLILVLAANTSFADFPRLASFHAGDNFMPRQLTKRGHRLVFSNGIIFLAGAAIVLLIVTGAKVEPADPALRHRRVHQLHAVAGRHGQAPPPPARSRAGARACSSTASARSLSFVVDWSSSASRSSPTGAWVIIVLVPVMVVAAGAAEQGSTRPRPPSSSTTRHGGRRGADPAPPRRARARRQLDLAAARAIQYARTLTPDELRAVHFDLDPARAERRCATRGSELGLPRFPLDIVECPDRRIDRAARRGGRRGAGRRRDRGERAAPAARVQRGSGTGSCTTAPPTRIAEALADLPHANVTFVPYHLGRRPQITTTKKKDTVKPAKRRAAPQVHKMPQGLNMPEGAIPISQADRRQRVCIAGRIRSVRVQPRAGVATLQCTLDDGTGEINLVFLGRRHVAGLAPGVIIAATGTVGERSGRQEILNPEYELLAASEHT